jgi:TRAP-type C4-dicarboxylate transport system substrate-binding protein
MSTVVWYSLSEQQQQWLQQAVDESVVFQKKVWKESSEESMQKVQEAGVEIIYPDKVPFRDAVKEMHEGYKGTTLYDLLLEIQSVN